MASDGHVEESLHNHAPLDLRCSCQASAEHLEQCAEFLPLRNEVEEMGRRLWARHLEVRKKQL